MPMKRFVVLCASLFVWIGSARAQSLPAWCGGASFETNPWNMNDLKATDPQDRVWAIARFSCSPSPAAVQQRATIEAARREWSAKLFMTDQDWGDAVASINKRVDLANIELSTKQLDQMSPFDQYRAIREGITINTQTVGNTLYLADALEGRLTEAGRLAVLRDCTR